MNTPLYPGAATPAELIRRAAAKVAEAAAAVIVTLSTLAIIAALLTI